MTSNIEDLSKFSGEEYLARAPQLATNQIRLDGKKGIFKYIDILGGLVPDETTGKRKYAQTTLGESVELVFLRIRRKLIEKMKGRPGDPNTPKPASSNEHNHKTERVTLWTPAGTEYGTSDELRVKYPNLRTHQIMYALYNNELVRLTVKGASLGSEGKADSVMDFYEYIGSFKENPGARDGKKDHFYDFKTILTAVEETSPMGEYYAMSFKRGDANDDTTMQNVAHLMKKVHEFTTQSDVFYKDKAGTQAPVEEPEAVIEAGDEDIIAEDIPF